MSVGDAWICGETDASGGAATGLETGIWDGASGSFFTFRYTGMGVIAGAIGVSFALAIGNDPESSRCVIKMPQVNVAKPAHNQTYFTSVSTLMAPLTSIFARSY